jgi:hypothetical protein
MAVHWMEGLANKHRETTFLNATEGGVPYFSPCLLKTLALEKIPDLQTRVGKILASVRKYSTTRFVEWEKNLRFQDATILDQLLLPLWRVWAPRFEKEKFSNMDLHQKIFFQRIIQEHLNALHLLE